MARRVPFWHSLAKPKPARREAFPKASLRAIHPGRPVRREAFGKASLRAGFGPVAILSTLPPGNLRKRPLLRRFSGQTCPKWPLGPEPARREAFPKASLRTGFPGWTVRREAFGKASLRAGFGFARLCQKGTLPPTSATPSMAMGIAIMMATGCHYDGNGLPL